MVNDWKMYAMALVCATSGVVSANIRAKLISSAASGEVQEQTLVVPDVASLAARLSDLQQGEPQVSLLAIESTEDGIWNNEELRYPWLLACLMDLDEAMAARSGELGIPLLLKQCNNNLRRLEQEKKIQQIERNVCQNRRVERAAQEQCAIMAALAGQLAENHPMLNDLRERRRARRFAAAGAAFALEQRARRISSEPFAPTRAPRKTIAVTAYPLQDLENVAKLAFPDAEGEAQ